MIRNYGWAVVNDDNALLVATVSPTRRGAIVNWLATDGGFLVGRIATDADIEQTFEIHKNHHGGARLVEVRIEAAEEA